MVQVEMGFMCITVPKPQKGVFRRIKDACWEVGLISRLCEHLQQIGVNATLLERGSSEATGPEWKRGAFHISIQSGTALGCVKIEGRNLDLVQVERRETQERGWQYLYQYVVRVKVKGLEGDLTAECRPTKKGLRREVVGLRWEGGRLARVLNDDFDLKSMLLKEGLHSLEIRPDEKSQCVRIIPKPMGRTYTGLGTIPALGREAFPTREAFEAYDRIAQHISSTASV